MAEYYQSNDSIEGNKTKICTRYLVFKSFVKDEKLGRACRYNCDRNASAEVTEILKEDEVPISENSKRSLGDKIRGDALYFLYRGIKKLKYNVKEGVSATHGAHILNTDTRTYACLTTPFIHLANVFNKRIEESKRGLLDSE